MSEHFLLGVLVVIAAIINLYGLMIVRDVHKLTSETLLREQCSAFVLPSPCQGEG